MTPPCNQWLASVVRRAVERCPTHLDAPNQAAIVLGYIMSQAALRDEEVDMILKRLCGVPS
jgi:hypothetical protein